MAAPKRLARTSYPACPSKRASLKGSLGKLAGKPLCGCLVTARKNGSAQIGEAVASGNGGEAHGTAGTRMSEEESADIANRLAELQTKLDLAVGLIQRVDEMPMATSSAGPR